VVSTGNGSGNWLVLGTVRVYHLCGKKAPVCIEENMVGFVDLKLDSLMNTDNEHKINSKHK
jgi:hypothetical protein